MSSLGGGLFAFRAAEMWRPDAAPPCRRAARQAPFVCALAAAAALAVSWSWGLEGEAFVQGTGPQRPAGHTVIVDKLPRGLTCRHGTCQFNPNVYGRKSAEWDDLQPAEILPYGSAKREEWSPVPQWRGEKSYHPSKELQNDEHRQWYHFNAEGKTLGHLAQAIAAMLRGKFSPLYDPIRDVGSFAVVTNCERVRVSGKKYHYKLYFRNVIKRPGHMKVERFKDVLKRFPERIIMRAVWGVMPKTKSSKRIFKERLKLFAGPNHLYYNKDPLEFPMHYIKDCTPTQSIRKRDRLEYQMTKKADADAVVAEWQKKKEDGIKLRQYKKFLSDQLKRSEEDEEVKDMTVQDFAANTQLKKLNQVFQTTQGQEIKKREKRVYWKTYLPKKRVSGKKGQRNSVPRVIRVPDGQEGTGPSLASVEASLAKAAAAGKKKK